MVSIFLDYAFYLPHSTTKFSGGEVNIRFNVTVYEL